MEAMNAAMARLYPHQPRPYPEAIEARAAALDGPSVLPDGELDREADMSSADIDTLRYAVAQARRRGGDLDLELEAELWHRTQKLNAFWGGADEEQAGLGVL